jgi:hypothetical protein
MIWHICMIFFISISMALIHRQGSYLHDEDTWHFG